MRTRYTGPLASLLFLGQGAFSARGAEPMKCVARLDLPSVVILARNAESGGTVHAAVFIGPDGTLERLELDGGEKVLQVETQIHLKNSTFRSGCSGQKINLYYEFHFEGKPTRDDVPPRLVFEPPDKFVIYLRRMPPIVN